VKRFLIALQFLTILPIRIRAELAPEDFGKSPVFPVVGLLIGLALAGAALLGHFLPQPVAAVLILILSIALTGGIHLDGFADTCDGFGGLRPKEKVLEIMRDSRVGVMGVTGVFCLLALKGVLLASVAPNVLWRLLILMTVFSRWSQVLVCCTSLRPSRKSQISWVCRPGISWRSVFAAGVTILMRLTGLALLGLPAASAAVLYYARKSSAA
jgi:adenosylcobinamide-GDP ribazoletransferase